MGIGKTPEKALGANYWTLVTLLVNKILQWSYSGYAEDNLFILYAFNSFESPTIVISFLQLG